MKVDFTWKVSWDFIAFILEINFIAAALIAGGNRIFGTKNIDDYCLFEVNRITNDKYSKYGLTEYKILVEVRNQKYSLSLVTGDYDSWQLYYKAKYDIIKPAIDFFNNNAESYFSSSSKSKTSYIQFILKGLPSFIMIMKDQFMDNLGMLEHVLSNSDTNQNIAMIYDVHYDNIFGPMKYKGPGYFPFYF